MIKLDKWMQIILASLASLYSINVLYSHLCTTGVNETHLVLLIQRPLQKKTTRKETFNITKCQIYILTEDWRRQQPAWDWMSQYWCDWFDVSSHQTTVPLVFSDLLTQTVELQLVDLQVRPDNKNPSLFILRLKNSRFLRISVIFHLAAIHWNQCKQWLRCVYSL